MRTLGWGFFFRRTLPAAYPSRMTKSGVIGLSPTVPRTPSVPKYLRIVEGFPDRDHVARFFHIMDPQYSRAALQSEQSHGQAAGQALADRPAGNPRQAGLA